MKNLVIIGNGFDLAHGLKTGYNDFVKHLINEKSKNPKLYSNILNTDNVSNKFPNHEELLDKKSRSRDKRGHHNYFRH
jgi:hypothetical protein